MGRRTKAADDNPPGILIYERMIKKYLPRGLFGRTLLILILPIFLLQGFGIYLFYERHWDKLAQRLSANVAGDIGLIVEWYEADKDWLDAGQRIRLRRYVDLDAKPGDSQDKPGEEAHYDYLHSALQQTLDERPFELTNPGGDNLTLVVQSARGPISIEVPKRRLYSSTTTIFVLWLVALTVLLATIAAVFLKRQVKPIIRLAGAVWSQSRHQHHHPVSPLKLEGAEEVRQATAAFLDMQERIKRHKDQRDALLSGVREDLQKPIDRIRLTLDSVLPNHPDTPSMLGDLRDMERMIDGYLSYVRDNRDEPLHVTKLKDLFAEAERLSGIKHLAIELREMDTLSLPARRLALTRAFANIIRNAVSHGATLLVVEGRPLDTDDGALILLCFEDDGRGMDERAMEEALHPFDVPGKTRDFTLAIAADIIQSHGGSLDLSKGVKGLRVSVVLPA